MRKIELAAAVALILTIFLGSFSQFCQSLANVQHSVLRLHILANSDSPEDQALKLSVRDALLAESESLFDGCDTLAQMRSCVGQHREEIRRIAEDTLRAQGCRDNVRVELVHMAFDTREYETLTMPAGEYDALRILIGEAKGHNWWCVMYPPLCLPAAGSPADTYFDPDTVDLLTEPGQYEVRFRCVEIFEELREKYEEKRSSAQNG